MDPILARLSLATLSAIVGGIAAVGLGRAASRRLVPLVFVALGTLLAVTLFDVLPDAKQSLSWPWFIGSAASGYLVFFLISRYLYTICPACAAPNMQDPGPSPKRRGEVGVSDESTGRIDDHTDHSSDMFARLKSASTLLMIALAIHCTVDGLAIVVGDGIAHGVDVSVLIAVCIHKLPEGMALALFLLTAGRTPVMAVVWTVIVESATLAGGLAGVRWLTHQPSFALALVFAHVGGGFLYLVTTTLGGFMRGQGRSGYRQIVLGGSLAFTITAVALLWTARLH